MAWAAETQWRVAFTLRPSGESPPRVAGSYVQWISVTSPVCGSLTRLTHLMK